MRLVDYTRQSSSRSLSIIHQYWRSQHRSQGLQLEHDFSFSAPSHFLDSRRRRTVAMQPANAAGNESVLPRSSQAYCASYNRVVLSATFDLRGLSQRDGRICRSLFPAASQTLSLQTEGNGLIRSFSFKRHWSDQTDKWFIEHLDRVRFVVFYTWFYINLAETVTLPSSEEATLNWTHAAIWWTCCQRRLSFVWLKVPKQQSRLHLAYIKLLI